MEDVNDKAPVFSKDQYDVSVYENLAGGTALVSLEVTDEDEVREEKQTTQYLNNLQINKHSKSVLMYLPYLVFSLIRVGSLKVTLSWIAIPSLSTVKE